MTVSNNLHSLRSKRGIGISELAQAAGVTRQTIYSIEAGSYTPNTAVALRLAKILNCSVEDLFSLDSDSQSDTDSVSAHLIDWHKRVYPGQPVQLCRVGSELIAVPGSEMDRQYSTAVNGTIAQGNRKNASGVAVHLIDALTAENSLIVAGCDPAATLLAGPLETAGIHLVSWLSNSSAALTLLKENRVHIAGCHMRNGEGDESNLEFAHKTAAHAELVLVRFVDWQEGLVVARDNPKKIQATADLARTDVCFVNREQGSGARRLLDRLLVEAGVPSRAVKGYGTIVESHIAVAQSVLSGKADCGISVGAAARMLGLSFVPLQTEHYDFVLRKEVLKEKTVQTFFEELNRSAVRRRLQAVCGYDTARCGNVMA